ncbi:serine/threonine-protein kinase, partial [Streptomyces sp. JJ38]|uniref:serine/threonine protein kinase n=1 Tax=Streptomyces sp. JJ38 TaxID=2738128 RepID=UPI001C57F442
MDTSLYIGPESAPDRYRLLRSIGRGGEAVLYLAEIQLGGAAEPVVVKVLDTQETMRPQEFAKISSRWSEQAELLRFVHRLGVVGIREHFEGMPPHQAGEAGTPPGRALCLVMNHVEGLDLRDWRAEHSLETPAERRDALRYLEQLAEVLDWLHLGKGTPSGRVVVHGDLSPGNVMIDANGQATLVDFGLSKLTAEHRTAEVWFTPGFAAPEVFEGRRTPATDRYAFGAIAYFLLSGESPASTPEQVRRQFRDLPALAAQDDEARDEVLAVFSADPAARPDSLSTWVKRLRQAVFSTSASSTSRAAAAGAAGAAAAAPARPAV